MTNKDVLYMQLNCSVGEIIKVPKLVKGDSVEMVDAEIVAKYPHHVLVQDKVPKGEKPKYKWCVLWKDILR